MLKSTTRQLAKSSILKGFGSIKFNASFQNLAQNFQIPNPTSKELRKYSSVSIATQKSKRLFRRSAVEELKSSQYKANLIASSILNKDVHALGVKFFSTEASGEEFKNDASNAYQKKMRNIGISAHIDSGKTTLTERVLFYTGRIKEMHEVKGKDHVGATMDFMELEREKGITIQSAATYCYWGDYRINVIDTPGHVDFTIEVERSLRVLDGAVLVLCGVAGVQSQTITVDRQMRRYNVPRVIFINKLDRLGADPWKIVAQVRNKLRLNAAALHYPIGLEANLRGVVDLVTMESVYFEGPQGENVVRKKEIPNELSDLVKQRREELLNRLADADDSIAEKVLEGVEPSIDEIKAAIRKSTIAQKFVPVLMGSALKNKGVQTMLDSVIDYLPNPLESVNTALDASRNEEKIVLASDAKKNFVGLAFKLEEGRFGQLTYMRVYQGTLARGDYVTNIVTDKKLKVPRIVRMHASEMEEIQSCSAGEICAMFGVDCATGNTFTDGKVRYTMTSMHIPEPVMSLAISPKNKSLAAQFTKALQKFSKEDPTFRVKVDHESGETIISGMGELHLDIYVERMRREYGVEATIGRPQVAYREAISSESSFEYLHKKQTGGSGQFAKVCGYLEPISYEEDINKSTEFIDGVIGGTIPPEYLPACRKGFEESIIKGPLMGHPVVGTRMVVNDGAAHSVDSSEMAFKLATMYAFSQAFKTAGAVILEPVMKVEVTAPLEFQTSIIGGLNKRRGIIENTESDNDYCTVTAEVPLNSMFGYSTDLRSQTQGKGEFSMEYKKHGQVPREEQMKLVEAYAKQKAEARK